MTATFYWWQFTFAQYAAEISFRKVINKMSRTATFYWWQLLFAQCAAEIRADALFLIHRLMLCVYWHEGSTTREKISYAEAVASAPFFFFFSRESRVSGSSKDIGNVMKLLLTHLWYLSSLDAFDFSIMEPSFVGLEFACGAWMHVLSTRVSWMDKAAFRATTHVCIFHTSGCKTCLQL